MRRLTRHTRPSPRGLGAISVLMVLVVLATLAAAIVRLASTASATQAQDIAGTRAWLAARAGTDWGLYQALKGSWADCLGASQTLDLRSDTGVIVSVSCNAETWVDGLDSTGAPQTVKLYTIEATACNGASACPDDSAATGAHYVERKRRVQAQR